MVVGIFNNQNSLSNVSRVGIKHQIFKTIQESNVILVSGNVKSRMPPRNRTHLLIANPDRTSPAQFVLVTDARDSNSHYSNLSIQVIGDNIKQLERHIENNVSVNDRGFRPLAFNFRPMPQLEKREPKVAEHIKSMRPMLNVSSLVYDDVNCFSEAMEELKKVVIGSCTKERLVSEEALTMLAKAQEKKYFSEKTSVNDAIVLLIRNTISRKMGLITTISPSPTDERPLG
jgi:hypothetical protein